MSEVSEPRLDYDTIAHLYDEPQRDHGIDPHLVTFLERRAEGVAHGIRILDVGCGTGKQLAANHER